MDWNWAESAMLAGLKVRRSHWPIEVMPIGTIYDRSGDTKAFTLTEPRICIWYVKAPYYRSRRIINEYGRDYINAWTEWPNNPNSRIANLGVPNADYIPTDEDKAADDWMLVDKVSSRDITLMDAQRWIHLPYDEDSYGYINNTQLSSKHLHYYILGIMIILAGLMWYWK